MELLPTILYVEDEEVDAILLRKALERIPIQQQLTIAVDGAEAIHYLSGSGDDQNKHCPPPWLVFLDLKLPGLTGFEVLEWIRQQPRFQTLPVIIYTSSDREDDREKARHLGANDYLVKEPNLEKLAASIEPVLRRWLHVPAI